MSAFGQEETGHPQPGSKTAERHPTDAGSACCHHHPPVMENQTGLRLLLTLGLNLLIPVAQVIGGVTANSMALISDATHNFSDFAAILIAYLAFRIARRGPSVRNTFGYRRAEIMAALINVGLLIAAAVVIVIEAAERVRNPAVVSGSIVMGLAAVGIAGNGVSAWLLHRDATHSLNIRGAFWHMVGDLLTSVAVLVTGAVLYYRPWYWLDPVLSFVIVVFILKNCWGIARESGLILMNSTPAHLDLEKVRRHLQDLPEICGVHYLHAWNVSSSSVAFSCHVVVPDQAVSRTEPLAEKIRNDLMQSFGIDHPVLQFETTACGDGDLLCQLACGRGNGSHA